MRSQTFLVLFLAGLLFGLATLVAFRESQAALRRIEGPQAVPSNQLDRSAGVPKLGLV